MKRNAFSAQGRDFQFSSLEVPVEEKILSKRSKRAFLPTKFAEYFTDVTGHNIRKAATKFNPLTYNLDTAS